MGEWTERLHPRDRQGRFGHGVTLGVTPATTDPNTPDVYSSEKFQQFEGDAKAFARRFGVTVDDVTRNEGVYKGGGERSYAITLHGSDPQIDGYAASLGQKYGQESVGRFADDPEGDDIEYAWHGVDPAAARAVAEDLGFGNIDGDTLTYWDKDSELEETRLEALSEQLGVTPDARPGWADFIEASQYETKIRAGMNG
jgi:hypothetical protein